MKINLEQLAEQVYNQYHNYLWWYSKDESSPDFDSPSFCDLNDAERGAWVAAVQHVKNEIIHFENLAIKQQETVEGGE